MEPSSFANLTHHSDYIQIQTEFKKKYTNNILVMNQEHPIIFKDWKVDTSDKLIAIATDLRKKTLVIPFTTKDLIEVIFPKPGFFTHDGKLFTFSRMPTRQYMWGANNENVYITDVLNNLIRFKSIQQFSIVTYNSALHRRHVVLSKDILDSPIHGFSLSNTLGVTIHPTEANQHLIWFNSMPIAIIVKNHITITNKNFAQELTDYLVHNNIKEFYCG